MMLSIIIPTYNSQETIVNTLKSINNQASDYIASIEIVIINDGSTDDTVSRVNYFSGETNLNICIVSQANGGVSSARNLGIEVCKGDYILFLDSDDEISDNSLNEIIPKLNENKYDLIIGGFDFCYISRSGSMQSVLYSKKYKYLSKVTNRIEALTRYLDESTFVSTCSIVFRKSIVDRNRIRFNVQYKYGEDQLFSLKLISCSSKICYIPVPVFKYNFNPNSAMNQINDRRKDSIFALYEFKLNCSIFEVTRLIDIKIFKEYIFVLNSIILSNSKKILVDFVTNEQVYIILNSLRTLNKRQKVLVWFTRKNLNTYKYFYTRYRKFKYRKVTA